MENFLWAIIEYVLDEFESNEEDKSLEELKERVRVLVPEHREQEAFDFLEQEVERRYDISKKDISCNSWLCIEETSA